MNNCYYDPYAQPGCKMPRQANYRNCMPEQCETECHKTVTHTEDCECERKRIAPFPENVALAMAYVPFQEMYDVYECMQALKCGTLFPQLSKPFTGCCRYD